MTFGAFQERLSRLSEKRKKSIVEEETGAAKTDLVHGMHCPKMLWLDHHKPEKKEIPTVVQSKLDQGIAFGDSLMGIFGRYISKMAAPTDTF